jgi:hypothetical protein
MISCPRRAGCPANTLAIPIPFRWTLRGPFIIAVGLYRGDTGVRLPRSDTHGDNVTLTVP